MLHRSVPPIQLIDVYLTYVFVFLVLRFLALGTLLLRSKFGFFEQLANLNFTCTQLAKALTLALMSLDFLSSSQFGSIPRLGLCCADDTRSIGDF